MRRTFGDRSFDTSNEDKALFPDGETKGDLIEYYARVADVLLPHVAKRPLTLVRCPDGIGGDGCFYQKEVPDHFPDWIDRVTVKKREGGAQTLVLAGDAATLAYLANQGTVTLHAWSSRTPALEHPDLLIVDLDPPAGASSGAVRRAALRCRGLFAEVGMTAFVKTTGSKGLHVVVALDGEADFESARAFAHSFVERLAARHPDDLTTEVRKARRNGRIYLDVARNAYAQTAVVPYAVRPIRGAPVAAPLEWDELGRGGFDARRWTIHNVFRRLAQRPDPWARLGREPHSVSRSAQRLAAV